MTCSICASGKMEMDSLMSSSMTCLQIASDSGEETSIQILFVFSDNWKSKDFLKIFLVTKNIFEIKRLIFRTISILVTLKIISGE